MIASIFHVGSGLGNQLHRYVMARVLAADLGVEFGMINPENFKGASFLKIDMGVPVRNLLHEFHEEKILNADNKDVRPYDPKIKKIKDFTLIDGEFQSEKYFAHRLPEIREWLKCEQIPFNIMFAAPEDTCIINFRGGEYKGVPDLYLEQGYWDSALAYMREKNPRMKFGIVTDDFDAAWKFFPNFDIRHSIEADWSAIRYAHNLILSNSSFAILPALLNENAKHIVAPRFWANHNKGGYWQLPQNEYSKFTYL